MMKTLIYATIFCTLGFYCAEASASSALQKAISKAASKNQARKDQEDKKNESKILKKDQSPIESLATRLLGPQADQFIFSLDPSLISGNEHKITIEKNSQNKIEIKAGRPLGLPTGLNLYLKNIARKHVSWAHNQTLTDDPLPLPDKKYTFTTNQPHATAFNYCTFNYTMSWWDWERWEREIDLLALYGVDHPLAVIGTEEVWARVLKYFGYTREEALQFPAGPAHTAWWLMGNIEGVGGPLSEHYVQSRVKLQKKILKRMRELGMSPILQGFVGIVPGNFTEKNPNARLLEQGQWCGMPRPPVLHPDDPLFEKIAQAWYEELGDIYGYTRHVEGQPFQGQYFGGDLFHEGGKTHDVDLPKMAQQVQNYMKEAHPEAVWVMQGWSGNPKAGLLAGVDKSKTEVVELCNEFFQNWKPSKGFQNTPWYFGTIIQYGGNIGLHGRLPAIFRNFQEAKASDTPPMGFGLTWESTEINPVVADLVTDLPWLEEGETMESWLDDYTVRRYGLDSPHLKTAWNSLLKSCYGEYPNHRRPTESIFCARPGLKVQKVSPFAASTALPYDLRDLEKALESMLKVSHELKDSPTYIHDLVDVTRQYLSGLGLIAYKEMITAYEAGNLEAFQTASQFFLKFHQLQDKLLGQDEHFMIGPWLKAARDMASDDEKNDYEKRARALVTTWFLDKKPGSLSDYGWRENQGLLADYYYPRWELFINHLTALLKKEPTKAPDYNSLEIAWTNKTLNDTPYATAPDNNAIPLAQSIWNLGHKWSKDNNRIQLVLPEQKKGDKQESSEDAR